jgi:hypothetical protein
MTVMAFRPRPVPALLIVTVPLERLDCGHLMGAGNGDPMSGIDAAHVPRALASTSMILLIGRPGTNGGRDLTNPKATERTPLARYHKWRCLRG